eukprot:364721-Chlamydomonas_euryale.AAC.2
MVASAPQAAEVLSGEYLCASGLDNRQLVLQHASFRTPSRFVLKMAGNIEIASARLGTRSCMFPIEDTLLHVPIWGHALACSQLRTRSCMFPI